MLMHVNLTVLGLKNIWSLFTFYCCIVLGFLHCKHRENLVFLFCNIHTQTGYYKKCICRLVANYRSYTNTKYYKNRSTFHRLITKIKRVTFLNTGKHHVNTDKWIIIFIRNSISTVNRCGGYTCMILLHIQLQ